MMDATLSDAGVSAAAPEMTKTAVLEWLQQHHYTHTYQALLREDDTLPHFGATAPAELLSEPDSVGNLTTSAVAELASSVEEALSAYQQLAGVGSVYGLLEHWDAQLLPTYCLRRSQGGSGREECEVERRMAELQDGNNRLRARERELEAQLKQTVTIIAERLQALVTSIDPMRKDILLPLLRTVAVYGSSSSVRAAARHMMLTLYKRPIVEHRLAMVQEWLRIARDAPPRTLEQELIPELYSLVNAPAFERRLLALDCAAAVAPLLRQSPQVRYSLCQGLLRPLCEDDTSAVRRELPRCLSLLWGDAGAGAGEVDGVRMSAGMTQQPQSNLAGSGLVGSGSVASSAMTAAAAATTAASVSAKATSVSLAPSQQAFVMELLVHLATDTNSRSVRQAAQTQLCEVLYPVFLRDNVLLTHFVPLLLTVISMEASQMLLLQRAPSARSAGSAAAAAAVAASASAGGGGSAGGLGLRNSSLGGNAASNAMSSPATTAGAGHTNAGSAAAATTSAAVAAALSLNNVITLVQLLHAALRCVAAEVVHSREAHDRRGGSARGSGASTNTAAVTTAATVAQTYLRVVLPTAHNLLVPLLSKMRFTATLGEDSGVSVGGGGGGGGSGGGGGGSGSGGALLDPHTQLCGSLCALCAALASLVPLLGSRAWDGVMRFLKTLVLAAPGLRGDAAPLYDATASTSSANTDSATNYNAGSTAALAMTTGHDASLSPQEILRGRLVFAFSYFLLLSGDAAVVPGAAEPVAKHADPSPGTAECASVPLATLQKDGGDGNRVVTATRSSAGSEVATRQIQLDSLSFLAHQVRLESDSLLGPRNTPLTTCVQCVALLAPMAPESHEISSGLTALIRYLASSSDARLRLTAVVLVHDGCAAIANERLKVTLLIEPLFPLLEDLQPGVQESALAGILSIALALTEPRAQEKTIRPVLRVADAAGCTSRFTRCMLMQWDQLMPRMPAEPREALLYPQLAALMDRLAEQYVERVSRENMPGSATAPPPPSAAAAAAAAVSSSSSAVPRNSFASTDGEGATAPAAAATAAAVASGSATAGQTAVNTAQSTPRELPDSSVEQWESTMLILQALLHSILRCAVVTPTLVSRYLLPGIQQLSSEGVLSACSSNVRTRWHRLLKAYLVFTENNTSRFSPFAANPSAANLLDRMKDELKKRL